MTHILIDLEALGLRPGAAIIELAAVRFDLATGEIDRVFHRHLVPGAPFAADLSTLDWHRARGTTYPDPHAVLPREAIAHFLDWLDRTAPDRSRRVLWSWGITYDFPLLEPYLDLRLPEDPAPWKYHQVRDARTVWQLAFGSARHRDRRHEAMADCYDAVADLSRAWQSLISNGKRGWQDDRSESGTTTHPGA